MEYFGTLKNFWLCFVPIFVAVDAIGLAPIFIGLTNHVEGKRLRVLIVESIITALAVALSFLLLGSWLLNLLGITVADFMVAGGVLLFVISMSDIIRPPGEKPQLNPEDVGAVPIGVPLIAGPAVLTTSLILLNQYGLILTAICIALNILIAGVIFYKSGLLVRFLGKAGTKAVSKVSALLLAAIAVMMIRKGIVIFLSGGAGD